MLIRLVALVAITLLSCASRVCSNLSHRGDRLLRKFLVRAVPKDYEFKTGFSLDGSLYILGARLTTSFNSGSNGNVSFDIFAHARDLTEQLKIDHPSRCTDTRNGNMTKLFYYEHAKSAKLYITFDGFGVQRPMNLIPTRSFDPNCNRNTLIWRASLHGIVSKRELLRHQASYLLVTVEIDVNTLPVSQDVTVSSIDPPSRMALVARVAVPVQHGAVGFGAPENTSPTPFLSTSRRARFVLCTGGIERNAVPFLPEFIRYHQLLGVDHVVLGLHNTTRDSAVHRIVSALLKHEIHAGTVVLAPYYMPGITCRNRDRSMAHFYNTCLYHAKAIAPLQGTWDLDEYFVPAASAAASISTTTATSSSNFATALNRYIYTADSDGQIMLPGNIVRNQLQRRQSDSFIAKLVSRVKGANDCTSWCYFVVPSYNTARAGYPNSDARIRSYWNGLDFPQRTHNASWIWQKPIVNTRTAHMVGFHMAGSCSIPGLRGLFAIPPRPKGGSAEVQKSIEYTARKQLKQTQKRQQSDGGGGGGGSSGSWHVCVVDGEGVGAMHHHHAMFSPRPLRGKPLLVPDEYATHFFEHVKVDVLKNKPQALLHPQQLKTVADVFKT